MRKIYAVQVNPEFAESDLFYNYKNKNTGHYELGFNDDFYGENIVIGGNRDFCDYAPNGLENLQKHIEEFNMDLQGYYGQQGNLTELANWYFKKLNGKKWNKRELHKWRIVSDLTENYTRDNEEKAFLMALELITDKKWRKVTLRGCCQRDWQEAYVSEEINDKAVDYIEACYFNTGNEYMVYDSYKDYKNDENNYSIYITGWRKEDVADAIGCDEKRLVVLEFDGYNKTPKYRRI